jgi:hypothetical protein
MKHITLIATLLGSVLLTACGFQSKTNLLVPTAPSSVTASTGTTASSSPSPSSPAAGPVASPASSPFAGTWAGPSFNGLPNIASCTDLRWQIDDMSLPDVAGSVSAVCGGSVTVTANLTGKQQSNDLVELTAKGQAVGFGITCGFSLNGVGRREAGDSIKLDYQGTTCLGPVSGSEVLRRASPAPQQAPSTPPPTAPEPAPASSDGAFGCSSISDNMKLVECIHDHIHPTNEYSAFEVTKRVAWARRDQGAGLLLKSTGENIVSWRGYTFAAGRILYDNGRLVKVIFDVGPGGANGPSWQEEGYLDPSRRVPALDPSLP